MKIAFRTLHAAGDIEKERLVFRVNLETDIGSYIVLASTPIDGSVSTDISHPYWFPDKVVKTGDLVVLYSKTGNTKQKTNSDNTVTHFFYWNLEAPIWAKMKSVPVLMLIDEWSTYKPVPPLDIRD